MTVAEMTVSSIQKNTYGKTCRSGDHKKLKSRDISDEENNDREAAVVAWQDRRGLRSVRRRREHVCSWLRMEASGPLALRLGVFADAEFELPAVGGFGALAPELEDAELGDVGLKANGDEVVVQGFVAREVGFE